MRYYAELGSKRVELSENKPSRLTVVVNYYYGGNWAKRRVTREEIAPQFFGNGKLKKSVFTTLKTLEVIERGYCPRNARESAQIVEVLS